MRASYLITSIALPSRENLFLSKLSDRNAFSQKLWHTLRCQINNFREQEEFKIFISANKNEFSRKLCQFQMILMISFHFAFENKQSYGNKIFSVGSIDLLYFCSFFYCYFLITFLADRRHSFSQPKEIISFLTIMIIFMGNFLSAKTNIGICSENYFFERNSVYLFKAFCL